MSKLRLSSLRSTSKENCNFGSTIEMSGINRALLPNCFSVISGMQKLLKIRLRRANNTIFALDFELPINLTDFFSVPDDIQILIYV